jgi:EF-P beta-lysylation protein EpmB
MTWQKALSQCITDPKELFSLLQLDEQHLTHAYQAAKLFPLRVPRAFVERIKQGDIADPLLNQILPLQAELKTKKDFVIDPLTESRFNPLPGLLHKYKNRVLFILSGACAVNCRYCFRRNFPYENNNPGMQGWEKVLAYLEQDNNINEIILSGGDPLVISDNQLKYLINKIVAIKHIKRLRIHTRLPIVLPERITTEFIDIFANNRLQSILVIHCNHPQEIDNAVCHALKKMLDANILLLNQSVLLKNINDNADILVQLSEKLFENGVLPYYLHLLDKVTGSAHFEVSLIKAKKIMQEVRSCLPGFLVPKLTRETAGAKYKMVVA